MTIAELEAELDWLEDYQDGLRTADPDGEWDQVLRDIDQINRLLQLRRRL